MRVFKTKWFNKWAKKEGLKDSDLALTISEMESGLIDADLGSNVYKKRVAKPGQGKSGSTRTIVAFKLGNKAFFTYGFAKKDKDNITLKELDSLKDYASLLFSFDDKMLLKALVNGELVEVSYD